MNTFSQIPRTLSSFVAPTGLRKHSRYLQIVILWV
jgi:hypothetical protein